MGLIFYKKVNSDVIKNVFWKMCC